MAFRGELFTTQVNLDGRSYFFNVKENRAGDVFLQIVESKIKDGQEERRDVVVFADDMKRFLGGLDDALASIEKTQRERARARAEKKAAKEARYAPHAREERQQSTKKVYRRKGESRLVADRRAAREERRTTGRLHVVSLIDKAGKGLSDSTDR